MRRFLKLHTESHLLGAMIELFVNLDVVATLRDDGGCTHVTFVDGSSVDVEETVGYILDSGGV